MAKPNYAFAKKQRDLAKKKKKEDKQRLKKEAQQSSDDDELTVEPAVDEIAED